MISDSADSAGNQFASRVVTYTGLLLILVEVKTEKLHFDSYLPSASTSAAVSFILQDCKSDAASDQDAA